MFRTISGTYYLAHPIPTPTFQKFCIGIAKTSSMQIFIVIFMVLFLSACRGPSEYELWQEEAVDNWRLLPHYGNEPKSPEMQAADDEFIKASIAEDGSARKAAEKMIRFGYRYLQKHDVRTAMYRFNQAWLLDHSNEVSYCGFASVYWHFRDYNSAIKMYDEGLKLNPDNTSILTHKANLYIVMLQSKFSEAMVLDAFELLKKSYALNPNYANKLHSLLVQRRLQKCPVLLRSVPKEWRLCGY